MLLVVAAAGCGASLISVTPASASCAGPATVETELVRADLVFVGTATALTNKNRWATFAVEDLWKGDLDLPLVDVHAGPPDPGGGLVAGSSVDRRYDLGVRYLVFAYDPASHGFAPTWEGQGRYEDNICTGTQPYSPDLDRFRPSVARRVAAPVTQTTAPSAPSRATKSIAPWIWAISVAAIVGSLALLYRRRLHSTPS